MKNSKLMNKLSKKASDLSDCDVICYEIDDNYYHFSIKKYKTYRQIKLNGEIIESSISNKWKSSGEYIYYDIKLNHDDIKDDKSFKYMIDNTLSR